MKFKKRTSSSRGARKKSVSEINPQALIKKANNTSIIKYESDREYSDLGLHSRLLKNITAKGYQKPTEIQDRSIEKLIDGHNLVGIASTGTGKTGAFLIPIIHRMLNEGITAIIVVPTRELAEQVLAEYLSLTAGLKLKSACFIGGTSVSRDVAKAKRKLDLIVGTPGRLNDLINQRALHIDQTDILVLDEFDRMLDMGFVRDIKKIISNMANREQTMLFSATVERSQEAMIKEIVPTSERVNISSGTKSSDRVDQDIIRVGKNQNKFDLLLNMVKDSSFDRVILFAETKRVVDKLSKQLKKSGVNSDVIHGNKSQNYRSKAIESFKKGKIKVLVATDVAARGIDVKGVTHVINYQLPKTMDSYIHRIGRTGRAEAVGTAYTFVD